MYTRTYIPFLRTVQCALNNRIMSLHFGGRSRIRPDSIQTVIFRFSGRGSSIFQVKEVRGKSAHNHKPSAAKFKRLAISPSPPRLPSYTVCRVPRATSLKRATVQGLVVHAHLMNVHGLMVKVLPTRRLGRPPRRPQNDHRTTRRRGGRSTRRRPTPAAANSASRLSRASRPGSPSTPAESGRRARRASHGAAGRKETRRSSQAGARRRALVQLASVSGDSL